MSDLSHPTELDLLVGSMFNTRPEEDRAQYEEEREWLSDIQDLLREEGVEVDLLSRPGVEIWEGGIDRYIDLYQLRQLAAQLRPEAGSAPRGPRREFRSPASGLTMSWCDVRCPVSRRAGPRLPLRPRSRDAGHG